MRKKAFAQLPKVDEILAKEKIIYLIDITSRKIVIDEIRNAIDEIRNIIKNADHDLLDNFCYCEEELIEKIIKNVKIRYQYNLKKVINATGVVLHTNLGRSPLPKSALDRIVEVASTYSNLEYDIDLGIRGSRYSHIEDLLCELTGAESAMVVNNNAAAVTLVLSTISENKEAIVSRGELVEIGGAFRIPEVMKWAGAKLVEVGTTNKTRCVDYENAISSETSLIMKVHTSNYKIVGFTENTSVKELGELGNRLKIPVYEDIGSGALIDLSEYGFVKVPTVRDSINAGIDIISFSGDKLLGGTQAGIIVGKKKFIDKMKKNHLNRAIRIDKLTLIALEEVLRFYRNPDMVVNSLPSVKMLCETVSSVKERCEKLKLLIEKKSNSTRFDINIVENFSQVGGGAMPMQNIPTYVLSILHDRLSANEIADKLRQAEIPIIGRIEDDMVILDVRTLLEGDDIEISNALANIE